MVLESITNPFHAERHVLLLFFVGMLYASMGVTLAYWVFAEQASIVMIVFVVLASMPLFYRTMRYAEKHTIESNDELDAIHRHSKTITFLLVFFLGMTLAFFLWHSFLPQPASAKVFHVQEATIINLNQQVTGQITQVGLLGRIVLNNMKVMIFSLLFSFIFGSGALFILTWNSSVIGTAMGAFVSNYIRQAGETALHPTTLFVFGTGMSIIRYFIHGLPEVLSYFVAGLAGGILSVAIIRSDLKENFNKIITDFSDLVLIAIIFLVIAGLIEVFVTPALF